MIQLTKTQRQAVEAQGERVLVSAGAGSGKTRVLVERFAHLVEHRGISPEQILALTFTDQAAREMKERILTRMGPRESELHVLTFHRFCGQVLRENPLQAQTDPAFSILPDSRSKHMIRHLVLQHLREMKDHRIALLLQHVHVEELVENLLALSQKKRERPLTWEEWGGQTETKNLDLRKLAWSLIQDTMRALADLEQSKQITAPNTLLRIHKMCSIWNALAPELRESTPDMWEERTVNRLLPAIGGIMSYVTGTVAQKAKPLFAKLRALKKERLWEDMLLDHAQEQRRALLELLRNVYREYQALKQNRGWCDFSDLQDRAYHVLRQHTAIRKRYGSRYPHVLVDEYQDTNPLQQAILELLEQGRREADLAGTLFMVGDRRQSIYRFRGADVKGFDAVQASLGPQDCYVELRDNFRATPSLHQLACDVSARLFSEPRGETVVQHPQTTESDLEILVPAKVEHGSFTESEARLLARRLRQMGPGVWGDTAILLQTRTHLSVFARALHTYGIPYTIYEDTGFFRSQEVQDVLHLLRTLADPDDAIALLGFLRGPLVRMPEKTLWAISRAQGLVHGFWQTEIDGLDKEEQKQVQAAKAALKQWKTELASQPLADWLHHLLYCENVEARIGGRSLEALVQLAEEGEEHGIVSLDALLAWWSELEASEETVAGQSEFQVQNAVRVMTIHAAKGLEFPIVCLPDLTHRQSAMMKRFHLCEQYGLVTKALRSDSPNSWQPTLAYAAAAELEKSALTEEKKRLFYVGLTRAKEKVILSGAASAFTEQSSLEECSNWWDWLPFLFPELQERGLRDGEIAGHGWKVSVLSDRSVPEFASVRTREEKGTASGQKLAFQDVGSEEERKVLFPRRTSPKIWRVTELTALLAGAKEELELSREWRISRLREQELLPSEWGQVVHAVFEHLTPHDDEQAIREKRIPAALARLGLAADNLSAEVWERIRGDVVKFQRSALYQEMSQAVECEHEVPFVLELVPGIVISGVIDALWLRDDGRAALVDYKTRRCETEHKVKRLVERYAVQVQLYALAVERLMGWQVDRAGIYLTAEGRYVEVAYGEAVREELVRRVAEVVRGSQKREDELEVVDLPS
jgi:ATP-dependent helicase/nuclease subunit A